MEKFTLRKNAIARRKSLDLDLTKKMSQEIVQTLRKFIEQRQFEQVFLYSPMTGEVDLMDLLSTDLARFAFPKVNGSEMDFFVVKSSKELFKQSYGLMEPRGISGLAIPSARTLILVPALLLDRQGNRVGLGKGYYDRYLHKVKTPLTLGVAFDEFVVDSLPLEPWDVPLGGYVTERKFDILNEIHK
jgi:5-formyltetrahydrofolate cyclo-ligase